MLRASPLRLFVIALLPAITLTSACLVSSQASAAGAAARYHAAPRGPVTVHHRHGAPLRRIIALPHHHRFGRDAGRYRSTRLSPGEFGYPHPAVAAGSHAPMLSTSAAEPAPPRQPGPVSFADMPASTGIRPAPVSQPLFMRLDGRQVVADDGERHLWRAGPRIMGLQADGPRRMARQPGQAHAQATMQGAPKIIVVGR